MLLDPNSPMEKLLRRLSQHELPTKLTDLSVEEIINKYTDKHNVTQAQAIALIDELINQFGNGSLTVDTFRTKVSGMRAGIKPENASSTEVSCDSCDQTPPALRLII